MDEINIACYFELLSVPEVLCVLENRPSNVEIVLTGRHAPAEFLELADLVTEMVKCGTHTKKVSWHARASRFRKPCETSLC
jgi:ATP:corrinoid adenosyltransferase